MLKDLYNQIITLHTYSYSNQVQFTYPKSNAKRVPSINTHYINTLNTYSYQNIKNNTLNNVESNNNNNNTIINYRSIYHRASKQIALENNQPHNPSIFNDDNQPHNPSIFNDDIVLSKFGTDIVVPNKIYRALYNHGNRELLRKVHSDLDVALEFCMLFCSKIVLYREFDNDTDEDNDEIPTTNLHSTYLTDVFGWSKESTRRYITIINVLMNALDEPIIECDGVYFENGKPLGYRFTERYYGKGWHKYSLKTDVVKSYYLKSNYKKIAKIMDNVIVKKIVDAYSYITLPTNEEMMAEAKRLIKLKYKNKKGKLLRIKGKHSESYFKGDVVFAESIISTYKLLTDGGYFIPSIGSSETCPRVYDSFSLMPSWIRELIKINNQKVEAFDYKALHPNIALYLYGSKEEKELLGGDVHSNIANKLSDKSESHKLSRDEIKIEHLSFFNKPIWQMEKSKLWNIYNEHAPILMKNLLEDKRRNGYKSTSVSLFKFEVEVMTEVIKRLGDDIKCVYVYDALYGVDNTIGEVMNEVAKEYGLLTYCGNTTQNTVEPTAPTVKARKVKKPMKTIPEPVIAVVEQKNSIDEYDDCEVTIDIDDFDNYEFDEKLYDAKHNRNDYREAEGIKRMMEKKVKTQTSFPIRNKVKNKLIGLLYN
jgi:hypothetical protein